MPSETHIGNILHPKELILKLHYDIDREDYLTRERILREHYKTLEGRFDKDLLEFNFKSMLGFIFWDAGQYQKAIKPLIEANQFESQKDYDSKYFLNMSILVTCFLELEEKDKSLACAVEALENAQDKDGSTLLNALKDYQKVIRESGKEFDTKYIQLIQKSHEWWGFDNRKDDWEETLTMMITDNQKWNRKLGEIIIAESDEDKDFTSEWDDYIRECPIAWYRDYVRKGNSG